jgi:hypothetical protein
VTPTRQLRVLRKGIHIRTHLPGIPELQLFTWLQEQHQKYPQLLVDVVLWPRIDMYDIQLRFADAVWAIDVKDHHRPHLLGRYLTGLYREGSLYWDRGVLRLSLPIERSNGWIMEKWRARRWGIA